MIWKLECSSRSRKYVLMKVWTLTKISGKISFIPHSNDSGFHEQAGQLGQEELRP